MNGNLDANNIRANSIETKNLKAGSVIAEKIDVDQLSAITADMGHITAGLIEAVEIFGSFIATAQGSYPRCEMSSTGNLFGAYMDADNFFEIQPVDPGTGAPTLNWVAGGSVAAQLYADASSITIQALARELILTTMIQGNIVLNPEVGYSVVLPSTFATLFADTGQSLQSIIQSLSDRISALGG